MYVFMELNTMAYFVWRCAAGSPPSACVYHFTISSIETWSTYLGHVATHATKRTHPSSMAKICERFRNVGWENVMHNLVMLLCMLNVLTGVNMTVDTPLNKLISRVNLNTLILRKGLLEADLERRGAPGPDLQDML